MCVCVCVCVCVMYKLFNKYTCTVLCICTCYVAEYFLSFPCRLTSTGLNVTILTLTHFLKDKNIAIQGISSIASGHYLCINDMSYCVFIYCNRLVDKANHRQQAIDRATSNVTQQIFEQQSTLKRNFLESIAAAGKEERDSLRNWRKVILLNTHQRSV